LQPEPLHHGGFEQGGGRVGVVLQQLGLALALAGEGEVEAPVDGAFVALPRLGDEGRQRGRDAELAPQLLLDGVPDCVQAHLV
jgi:hypothetical protein